MWFIWISHLSPTAVLPFACCCVRCSGFLSVTINQRRVTLNWVNIKNIFEKLFNRSALHSAEFKITQKYFFAFAQWNETESGENIFLSSSRVKDFRCFSYFHSRRSRLKTFHESQTLFCLPATFKEWSLKFRNCKRCFFVHRNWKKLTER